MSDDWRCEGCKGEIMADDNTHSFGGKTWHTGCKKKDEDTHKNKSEESNY